jgi:hypothetical protein
MEMGIGIGTTEWRLARREWQFGAGLDAWLVESSRRTPYCATFHVSAGLASAPWLNAKVGVMWSVLRFFLGDATDFASCTFRAPIESAN